MEPGHKEGSGSGSAAPSQGQQSSVPPQNQSDEQPFIVQARRKRQASHEPIIETQSSDDDEEEEYQPSLTRTFVAASENMEIDDDSLEEAEGSQDGDESAEEFEDGSEIPVSHEAGMNFGKLELRRPLNPSWRVNSKVSYKGKTDQVRKLREVDPRPNKDRGVESRFWTFFQMDFYENVILSKNHPVAMAQWINWNALAAKDIPIFNKIIAACEANHIKDIMGFKQD